MSAIDGTAIQSARQASELVRKRTAGDHVVLTEADWIELDTAFADNSNPLGGLHAHEDFNKLFKRIVELAPPPIGVGPT